MATVMMHKGEMVQDPPLVQKLMSDPRAGWVWVLPRLWLGWQWFEAAQHKLGNPAWVQTGEALKGFWLSAVKIPETGEIGPLSQIVNTHWSLLYWEPMRHHFAPRP